jgi:hypothetical protein
MDTLTIEIRNPKVRELLDNLASLDLISIVPKQPSWRERWQNLSVSLPNTSDISEQDILDEIQAVRETRNNQP